MKPQDMKDLRELIEFLKQYQVAEFDLDRGDLKIRLKFAQEPAAAGLADIAKLVSSAPVAHIPTAPVPPPAPHAAATSEKPADPDAGLHIVKSPIVGTFYGSPSPGAPPFASPGDHVEKGQVICIVEAMKLKLMRRGSSSNASYPTVSRLNSGNRCFPFVCDEARSELRI